MTADRLTPEREAEIAERVAKRTAEFTEWLNKYSPMPGGDAAERAETVLEEDVPALLAELAAVRAERDQAQVQLAEYEPLNPQQCPTGKHADWLVDSEYAHACPWCRIAELEENLRAVNAGWSVSRARVAELEAAQQPATEEDASDNRRRIYIDGKGNGWISVCSDEGTEWVVPVQPEAAVEQDVRDVADDTGSLREIGRCW